MIWDHKEFIIVKWSQPIDDYVVNAWVRNVHPTVVMGQRGSSPFDIIAFNQRFLNTFVKLNNISII